LTIIGRRVVRDFLYIPFIHNITWCFRQISNIDVSSVVIRQMQQLHKERSSMSYQVMDALNMTYPEGKFSVVLDKGTLDALMPQVQTR